MLNLTQVRIRWLIVIGYSVPILLLLLSTYLIQGSVQRASRAVSELDAYNIIEKQGDEVAFTVEHLRVVIRCYMLDPNAKILQELKQNIQLYHNLAAAYQAKIQNSEQQKIFTQYKSKVDAEILFVETELIPLINQGKLADSRHKWHEEYYGEIQNDLATLMDRFRETGDITYAEIKQEQDAALSQIDPLILQVTAASVIVAIATGFLIISVLIQRLNQEAIAIASSCSQIAETFTEQDRTASEQASSVNETTISVEQLRRSAEKSALQAESAAVGARQILHLASGDREHSEHSNGNVCLQKASEEIADKVQSLSEELNQIYRITNVVTELASQTNMLALNAAVEAVRSGDQGRGFAVLATEIRKLADESRKASERINQLIENLQKSANSTVNITEKGTQAVENMVTAINDISGNVQEIASNVQEQASAINQIMIAMNTINAGVQQTSSRISQTKLGIEQLDQTAQHLKALV